MGDVSDFKPNSDPKAGACSDDLVAAFMLLCKDCTSRNHKKRPAVDEVKY